MTELKLVTANTTRLDEESNAALVDCYDGGDNPDEREPYGELPMMCDLGSITIPFPPTAEGKAEVIVVEGVGGANGRACAAWDTRTASIAGNLEPGDRCEHAPHPNKAVQILLKGEKRVAAIVVVAKDGSQAILSLAGKEGFNLNVQGHQVTVNKDGIALCSANGQHGIEVTDQGVSLRGNITAGPAGVPGETLAVAQAPVWAALAGLAGGAMRPVFGVKIGG